MTEDLTPNGGTDQLEGRLRALHTDTDGVILADPRSVRRHGDRRRRMAQAGTVLGVAVLAVGVVGVAGTLTDRPGAAPPAVTSPGPSESGPTMVTTDALLQSEDIAPIGPYTSFVRSEVGSTEMHLSCLSDPSSWGATRGQSAVFASDLDATFVETALQFPDVASASNAAQHLFKDFSACPTGDPGEAQVTDRDEALGVGVQGYRFSRLTTPTADAGLAYNEVAVARIGTVVVVLDWSSMGSPVDAPDWAWTPEQVALALERAVA